MRHYDSYMARSLMSQDPDDMEHVMKCSQCGATEPGTNRGWWTLHHDQVPAWGEIFCSADCLHQRLAKAMNQSTEE